MGKVSKPRSRLAGIVLTILIAALIVLSGRISASTIGSAKGLFYSPINAPIFAISDLGYGTSAGTGAIAGPATGASTLPPIVTNTSNGYNISNIAQLGNVNLVFCGQIIKLTDNFISPNSTGITINSGAYTLAVGQPVQLSLGSNCYAKLLNVSYLPILQTVQLQLYNTSVANNTLVLNNALANGISFNVSPLGLVSGVNPASASTLINITIATNSTPSALNNFVKLEALNISINNSVNSTALVITATVQCGYSTVAPFILLNNTWRPIDPSTYNSTLCSVAFIVPSDPVVAFMAPSKTSPAIQAVPLNAQTNTSSTNPSQINSVSTVQPTAQTQQGNTLSLVIKAAAGFAAAIAAVLAVITLLSSSRKKKEVKTKPKKKKSRK